MEKQEKIGRRKKPDYKAMPPEEYWFERAMAGERLIKAMNQVIVNYRIGRNSGDAVDRLMKAKATLKEIAAADPDPEPHTE